MAWRILKLKKISKRSNSSICNFDQNLGNDVTDTFAFTPFDRRANRGIFFGFNLNDKIKVIKVGEFV